MSKDGETTVKTAIDGERWVEKKLEGLKSLKLNEFLFICA